MENFSFKKSIPEEPPVTINPEGGAGHEKNLEKPNDRQAGILARLRDHGKRLRILSAFLTIFNTNNPLSGKDENDFSKDTGVKLEYNDPTLSETPDGRHESAKVMMFDPESPEDPEGYKVIKTINIIDVFEHGVGDFDENRSEVVRQAIARSLSDIMSNKDYADFLRDGRIAVRVSSDITYGSVDIDGDGLINGPREMSGSATDTKGSQMSGYDYSQAKLFNTQLSAERAENIEGLIKDTIGKMVLSDIADRISVVVVVEIPKNGQPTPADLHGPGTVHYTPEDFEPGNLAKQRYADIVFEQREIPKSETEKPKPDHIQPYLLDISPSMIDDVSAYLKDWAQKAEDQAAKRGSAYRVQINIQPFAQGETDPNLAGPGIGGAFTSKPAIPDRLERLGGPVTPGQAGETYREISVTLIGDPTSDQRIIQQVIERLKGLSNTARSNETAILAVKDYLEKHPRRAEIIAGNYKLELGTDEPLQDVNMQVLERILNNYPKAQIVFAVKSQIDNPRRDPSNPLAEGSETVSISLQDLYRISAQLIADDPELRDKNLEDAFLSVYPFESKDTDGNEIITWKIKPTLKPHSDVYQRTSMNVGVNQEPAKMSPAQKAAYGLDIKN